MPCPHCPDAPALQDMEVQGVSLRTCPGCEGLLLAQNRLVPLVEAMTKGWVDELDPDMEIEAHPDAGRPADCPDCSRPMTAFGYMGTKLVTLDRCRHCELLWTDPGELSTVGLLFARTRRRTSMRRQAREEMMRDTERRFDRLMQRQRVRSFLGLHGGVSAMVVGELLMDNVDD